MTVKTEDSPGPAVTARPSSRLPSTDAGTVVIHWLTVTALVVSLLTGLRIAGDDLDSVAAKALSPILPQGEVWTIHFFSGLSLFFCSSAYVLYMARSGLQTRIAGRRLRPLVEARNARLRWGALNVLLHWLLYGLLITLTATGVMLYLGHGGWIVRVHEICAFATLGYFVVHVTTHYLFGGWRQLLRIVRPLAPLGARGAQPAVRGRGRGRAGDCRRAGQRRSGQPRPAACGADRHAADSGRPARRCRLASRAAGRRADGAGRQSRRYRRVDRRGPRGP
ncbi:MAG: cytochrome b/b6 domain-containing protein [Pseudomonadota bacterium]